MLYAQVGRKEASRKMFEKGFKEWSDKMKSVRFYMTYLPFKDQQAAERIAEGYVKAGLKGPPPRIIKSPVRID